MAEHPLNSGPYPSDYARSVAEDQRYWEEVRLRSIEFSDHIDWPGEIDNLPLTSQFTMLCDRITTSHEQWLAAMPYYDFLATRYWKIVAEYHRIHVARNRCSSCGVPGRIHGAEYVRGARTLHTHHKTYFHRGREHRYPADLIVLCGPCHEAIYARRKDPK